MLNCVVGQVQQPFGATCCLHDHHHLYHRHPPNHHHHHHLITNIINNNNNNKNNRLIILYLDNGGSSCLRNVCKSVPHYTSSPHKAIIFKIVTSRTSHLTLTQISFLTIRKKDSQPQNGTDKIIAFITGKQRYW